MWDDIATKYMIIKMLSESLNNITNSFYNSDGSDLTVKRQQNPSFMYPKGSNSENSKSISDNAFNRQLMQITIETITLPNRFSLLQNYELSKSDDNESNYTNFECKSSKKSTIKRNHQTKHHQ